MFYDVDKSEVTLSEWDKFRGEFPPSLIEEVISREAACLPDWFVPSARGVVVASAELLSQVGHRNGKHRPRGWLETSPDYFLYPLTCESSLLVRECENTNLWTIERLNSTRSYEVDEVLAFKFGWTPIFTRSYQSAMRLAMRSHTNGPPSLRWINTPQNDMKSVIEFAKKRRFDEGYARS